MEIFCWKEGNRPERVKATTGSKPGSEIWHRVEVMEICCSKERNWEERAKATTGSKAAGSKADRGN